MMTYLRRAVFALVLILTAGAAAAQEPPDYAAWRSVAERAEIAVENGRASSAALEQLRLDIVGWREQFLTAQGSNAERINTLQSQIAALGAVADGESEAPDIAARRVELQDQLTRLRTPVVTAEEAYSRANGIVGEIDRIIRERQTEELLRSGPSPLNPVYWPPALDALWSSINAIWQEVGSAWSSTAQRKSLLTELTQVTILGLIGLVLVLRGRRLGQGAVNMFRRAISRGHGVWDFMASLMQIIVPYFGLAALVGAVFATGLIGLRGTLVLDAVPQYGLTLLVLWWLADQLFPRDEKDPVLPLGEGAAPQMRWYMIALGLVWIAAHVLSILASYDRYSTATVAVLTLPLLVVGGLMLFRVGSLMRSAPIEPNPEDGAGMNRLRAARLLGRAAQLVAVAGVVLGALGFGTGAERLIFSSLSSLALFGLVLVLQTFVRAVYGYIMPNQSEEDGLIPVLLGFALALAAMPVLALIWGARVADLSELWTRFQEGFSLGESRISPMDFLAFVLIFTIGYLATRLLQGAMRNSILPRTQMDTGGRNAVVSGIGYIGIFLAALIAITSVGIDLSSVAIVAGALSVGIGFGLQNIVSNFVSGIILLIERPIAEGDWIEVGGTMGYVRRISVRSTRIETFDRTDVIVPNADFVSGPVTNWTRGKTIGRVIVPVGVAYGNDTRKVEKILMEIARGHSMVLMNPGPSVVFQGFGADSLDFEIRAILRDVNYMLSVKSDMNHEIARRFVEEGIEIPFAQRDIWIRNPEALAAGMPPAVDTASSNVPDADAEMISPAGDTK